MKSLKPISPSWRARTQPSEVMTNSAMLGWVYGRLRMQPTMAAIFALMPGNRTGYSFWASSSLMLVIDIPFH
jgi:hypothetical protein